MVMIIAYKISFIHLENPLPPIALLIIVIFTCPKTPKPSPDNLPGFGFWFFVPSWNKRSRYLGRNFKTR
jgi:hypothetical protein